LCLTRNGETQPGISSPQCAGSECAEPDCAEAIGNDRPDVHLHHVGFVVPDIASAVARFGASVGATWDGLIFHDPLQKVKVTFLTTSPSDGQIELVEPAAPDAPVVAMLKKGGGLHHLCYDVPNLPGHLRYVRKHGGMLLKAPVPAVAFEGRQIAWVLTREKLLLEFLQR
jgi:methylmalonyl-CoA/ethylmalonyl-CoA epimerase